MGEIKTQTVRSHQRAGLFDMIAQHLPQGRMQQMGGAVVGFGIIRRLRCLQPTSSTSCQASAFRYH